MIGNKNHGAGAPNPPARYPFFDDKGRFILTKLRALVVVGVGCLLMLAGTIGTVYRSSQPGDHRTPVVVATLIVLGLITCISMMRKIYRS